MAGLPRSGSTLLSNILNQNKSVYSSTNSPLLHINIALINETLRSEQYRAFPKPECLINILSELPHNFYRHYTQDIIIDKSRSWPAYVDDIIERYITTDIKIICPVRRILDILSSFMSAIQRSDQVSYIDHRLSKMGLEINNTNRCDFLMSRIGTVGEPYGALRRCILKGYRKNLLFVDYDDLIGSPQFTMNSIYKFLELPSYSHDFSNIVQHEVENDAVYGITNMHAVKSKLVPNHRNYLDNLDKSIIEKYKNMEFWKEKLRTSIFGL